MKTAILVAASLAAAGAQAESPLLDEARYGYDQIKKNILQSAEIYPTVPGQESDILPADSGRLPSSTLEHRF